MEQEDLYEILGIANDASEQQVRAACRRILTQVHPDHGGSDALFRVVYRAYSVLTDPERRAAYDASLAMADAAPRPDQESTASEGDDPKAWAPPEPRPPGDHRQLRVPSQTGIRPTISVARHPSLSVLVGTFVLFVVSAVADLHGLVSFSLVVGGISLVGQAGHRRAARAERARRARIDDVDAMEDAAFERHLVAVFRRDGFAVRTVPQDDTVVRLLLRKAARITAVTAEHGEGPVEVDLVREAAGARARYGAAEALAVANSTFTPEAAEAAERSSVALMGRAELTALLASQAAAPPARGLELLRRELQHGIPAVLELVSALLRGVLTLLEDLGAAWEAGTAPAEDVAPLGHEATPPEKDAAAS